MALNIATVQSEAARSAALLQRATSDEETQSLIKLNGRYYHVAITNLERTINITDGENAGRTKPPAAEMIRDIVGVYVGYSATFEVKTDDISEYDDMILTLSQPVDSIPVVMPFGQGTLSFDAYVTKIKDKLLTNINGVRRWGNCTVEFTPMRAQIKP